LRDITLKQEDRHRLEAELTHLPRRGQQGFTANYLRLKNLPSDNG